MSSFNTHPFYTSPEGVKHRHNTRLYRPVESLEGSNALTAFYDHAREVLENEGFDDDDVTLLACDKYEISIVSKGSINLAVNETKDPFFRTVQTKTIQDVLLEGLPGSARRPIPAVIDKVGVYRNEKDESGDRRYVAAFLRILDENMKSYVGVERFGGYDGLRVFSKMDEVFGKKLRKLKPATFRFCVFHDPTYRPTKELMTKLMPTTRLMHVILGEVQAGAFDR